MTVIIIIIIIYRLCAIKYLLKNVNRHIILCLYSIHTARMRDGCNGHVCNVYFF